MSDITQEDLKAMQDNINQHIDDKLEPMIQRIEGHQKTLYGEDGREGLVKDVNTIQTGGIIIKCLVGLGLGSSFLSWFVAKGG